MQTIHTQDGAVAPYRHTGMWRANHRGLHFCSPTWNGLIEALGHLNSLSVKTHVPPPEPESDEDRLRRVLRGRYPIHMKQAAYHEARERGLFVTANPLSFNARSFARKLDKPFDRVTHEELVQYEPNLVKRNGLVKELAELFQAGF